VGWTPHDDYGTLRATLYFQRKGDDWQASIGGTEYYRWWCTGLPGGAIDLIAGEGTPQTLSCPLDWHYWSDVRGKQSELAFAQALADPSNVGITFGGDGGLGHGVAATGRAEFELTDFVMQ
jgi:hypothetical protein